MSATRQDILDTLAANPDGLTSAEVSRNIKGSSYAVQSMLSRLAAYGAIDKIPGVKQSRRVWPRNKCTWRLKPKVASPSIATNGATQSQEIA